jgi:hypothetical protein
MALSREKIDLLAENLADALLDIFKEAKKEGKAPPLGALATTEKLLGSIEVGRGQAPVIPPPLPPSAEDTTGSPLDTLRARGLPSSLPFPSKKPDGKK